MNVTLIYPLIQKSLRGAELDTVWPPLGLLYVASSLEKQGCHVQLLERRLMWKEANMSLEKTDELTIMRIREARPDMVGITATTPLITDAMRVARIIKQEFPDLTIILGGVHPTLLPLETLKDIPEADIVVIGDGEIPISLLAQGAALEKIPGIAYRDESGKIKVNGIGEVSLDLDEIAFPARHLLDKKFYFRKNTILARGLFKVVTSMFTSRGCPFRCYFCSNEAISETSRHKKMRYHSPAYVIREITHLVERYNIAGLVFADDMFLTNRNRAKEICCLMAEKGLNKRIMWTANVRADSVDRELLGVIKEANCIHLVMGIESGSQRMLNAMNKNVKVDTYRRAARLIHEAGLSFEANIIHGLPEETEEDFRATIGLLKDMRPNRIFCSKFYPMPGSVFYNRLIAQRRMVVDTYDDIFDKYYLSRFTFADIPYSRFEDLCKLELRRVILPVNYSYGVKNNLRYPLKVLKYSLLFFIHPVSMYIPNFVRQTLLGLCRRFSLRPV